MNPVKLLFTCNFIGKIDDFKFVKGNQHGIVHAIHNRLEVQGLLCDTPYQKLFTNILVHVTQEQVIWNIT